MGLQQIPSKGGIPSGNTASRPGSPVVGDTFYNGQLGYLEIFNGTVFIPASASPGLPSITSVTDVGTNLAFETGGTLTVIAVTNPDSGLPLQFLAKTSTGGFSATSTNETISLSGLTPATSFQVSVNASNNFGTSVDTPLFSAVTATTVPQIRTIGTATPSTSVNELTVTWTNTATGGKALSAITITPFLNGTTAETSRTAATTSSTSYTFTEGQLTAGSAYTFKVKATNANGTCADSTATNSANMPNLTPVEYVIQGGGGGAGGGESGAGDGGGGGGAGGYITGTINLAKGTTHTVEVGSGGAGTAGPAPYLSSGANGVLSRIQISGTTVGSLSAAGGGGGGGNDGPGLNGGCGGGASGDNGASGGIGSQGGNGGNAGGNRAGGGGGGAGGNGATTTSGGNGGIGVTEPIKSLAIGGGGGGAGGGGLGGRGTGSQGGGSGGFGQGDSGSSGTANTGGGGGGGHSNGSGAGGNGGSGVVILKSLSQATATTGSPTATTSGSYYIYQFNAAGSITY
jgi:hypothetical protein